MRPHSPPPGNRGTRLHCVPMATRADHPSQHPFPRSSAFPCASPAAGPGLSLHRPGPRHGARDPAHGERFRNECTTRFLGHEEMNAGRQGRGEENYLPLGLRVSSLAPGGHSFPICRTGTLDAAHTCPGRWRRGRAPGRGQSLLRPGGGRLRSLPRPGAWAAARRHRDATLRKPWRGGLAHLEVTSTGGDCMTATAQGGARAVTGPWALASQSPRPRSQPARAPSAARP